MAFSDAHSGEHQPLDSSAEAVAPSDHAPAHSPQVDERRRVMRTLAWLWVPGSVVFVGACLVMDGIGGWSVVLYIFFGGWTIVALYRLLIAGVFHLSTRSDPARPVPRWLVPAIVAQELTLDLAVFFMADADDSRSLSVLEVAGVSTATSRAIEDALVVSALVGAILLFVVVVVDLASLGKPGDGVVPYYPSDT